MQVQQVLGAGKTTARRAMMWNVIRRGFIAIVFLMIVYWVGLPDLYTEIEVRQDIITVSSTAQIADRSLLDGDDDMQCEGHKVYMYNLPPSFNIGLREMCRNVLVSWLDICVHFENSGFGLALDRPQWYGTDAYMLEVIFHKRMERYPCLTQDPSAADAFFIPYYTGLDALPFLYNNSDLVRNRNPFGVDIVAWLESNAKEWWGRYGGKDHFMVLGRTTWDFKLPLANQDKARWGTSLLSRPHIRNLTSLLMERDPWSQNEQAIPYPTSFHPSSFKQLQAWIKKVRRAERKYLYAFVGAPRPDQPHSIRGNLASQCLAKHTQKCKLVDCSKMKCSHNPEPIVDSLLQSEFCLQPKGDTATRRSTFDSIIAGCIPVFMHNDSAYNQYTWHLPSDPETYSVFISEDQIRAGVLISDILAAIPKKRITAMRKTLLHTIPNILYFNYTPPQGSLVQDAFHITVSSILRKIYSFKSAHEGRTIPPKL